MKIRQGFVSNSSSSSFIIGIGEVTDLEKALAVQKEHPELKIVQIKDILAGTTCDYGSPSLSYDKSKLEIDTDYGSGLVSIKSDLSDENKHIAYVNIHNGEGDWEESVLCECVYEGRRLDLDYFSADQQYYLDLNKETHGISDWDSQYGCGRDG
jgi:hypothetical protein